MEEKIVIGIVSLPGDGTGTKKRVHSGEHTSHIVASYPKLVGCGGGRVIPLLWNEPEELFLKKLDSVNGVLLTGGMPPQEPAFLRRIKLLFKYVINHNDKEGNYLPLFGICLGFQYLVQIVSENDSFFPPEEYTSLQNPSPLKIEMGNEKTLPFSMFTSEVLEAMKTTDLPYHNNRRGVSPKKFEETANLTKFFEVLSTSKDKGNEKGENKLEFVSTIKARDLPIYGIQWHAEKHCFEFSLATPIPHSDFATQITQTFGRFIASEARKSSRVLDDQFVLANLIYNHPIAFAGKEGKGYDEIYYFTKSDLSSEVMSMGGSGGEGGRRGSGCYRCGKEGHFARECPSGDH